MATFASRREKSAARGEVVGKREWKFNCAIGDERTVDRPPDRKKITTNRFSLSLFLSIFRNEPMSKWWYYWLIRLGSELRNRRGRKREIRDRFHSIVSRVELYVVIQFLAQKLRYYFRYLGTQRREKTRGGSVRYKWKGHRS